MGIRENIIKLRDIYGVTQEQLAKIAGVTRGAVSQWEGGFSEPRMGAIQNIASHFGIRKSNIIEDGGMELIDPVTKRPRNLPPNAIIPKIEKTSYLPLRGGVHAGTPDEPDTYDEMIALPDSIAEVHPQGYFLKVQGDCMDRVYPEGCLILVDPDKRPSNGSIAAVMIDGHDAVMRRLYRGASTMVLSPDSYNAEHKDIVISADDDHTIELVGTVVWFQSDGEME